MFRKFAEWLSESVWRATLFAAILGVLSLGQPSFIAAAAGALVVLMTLRHSVAAGIQVALAGSAAVTVLLIGASQQWTVVIAAVMGLFFAPLLFARLLRRTGALTLCFQVSVLSALLLVAGAHALLDDPIAPWRELIDRLTTILTEYSPVKDKDAVRPSLEATIWGAVVGLWWLFVLSAVFLGRWWQSLLEAPGAFGAEFRKIRLGALLGGACALVVVGLLVSQYFGFTSSVLAALSVIAVMAMAMQGLAALHTLKAVGRIGRAALIAVYVLVVMLPIAFLALAGWGMADNWQRSKARV